MSILETIKIHEAKAEQLKKEANDQVRVLLEQTRLDTESKIQALYNANDHALNKAYQATVANIASQKAALDLSYQMNDQKVAELAKSRFEKIATELVKKELSL